MKKTLVILSLVITSLSCENQYEEDYEDVQIQKMIIVGRSINTTFENGQFDKDYQRLMELFYSKLKQVKHVENKTQYLIYTDYSTDYNGYTGSFNLILGVEVDSVENIPNGWVTREFSGGKYKRIRIEGSAANFNEIVNKKRWKFLGTNKIQNRKYSADFEAYSGFGWSSDRSMEFYISTK